MQGKNNITNQDLQVLNFISEFKMLKVEDARLIYKTKRYYRQRINKLIDKGYVKRYKNYIIIDKNGRKILNKVGSSYIKNITNEAYMERLRHIASIATISLNSKINFIASWDIKEKDIFTETARRYIGKLVIDNKEYLSYYISSKKQHVYIKQLLFDIKKAINYEDILIFVEDLSVINSKYSNLVFGKKNTYVILNTSENRELIRKILKINIHELLENIYEKEIMISNWDKADYMLEEGIYILYMPFINTEKLERIRWYYQENKNMNRKLEVITLKENIEKVSEILGRVCKINKLDRNMLGGISEPK